MFITNLGFGIQRHPAVQVPWSEWLVQHKNVLARADQSARVGIALKKTLHRGNVGRNAPT